MRRIALLTLALIATPLASAQAGIWEWACQGQMGEQQVFFNRFQLYVITSKKPLGSVEKMMGRELAQKLPAERAEYETNNGNDGFTKTITGNRAGDETIKLELIEKSSRKLSHKHRYLGGRDEDTDTFRKIYSIKLGGEPARDITMQCIEYQLSTCGGRCK